jgi:hypothetical protein
MVKVSIRILNLNRNPWKCERFKFSLTDIVELIVLKMITELDGL